MGTKCWIGPEEAPGLSAGSRPAYWLRHEFEVAETAEAQLTFSARGLVEVFVNGIRIGDELLPGYVQYDDQLPRRNYELADVLTVGTNTIVIVLADGWYRGQTGAMRAVDQWGTDVSVWAQITIGQETVAATDASWRSTRSHITRADLIAGQSQDQRLLDPTVYETGFDVEAWDPVVLHEAPVAPLVDYDAPPVRRVEELTPRSVTKLDSGSYVVDFAQNINGWVRLTNLGPTGTEVTLTHAEWVGPDGDITTDHLRVDFPFLPEPLAPGQIDSVISAGREGDTFEPRLTTHGFRFVRLDGHPGPISPDDISAIVVHSDLERTGRFTCSDERINKLHEAAVWTLRSNICEIPTDCPQRERAGWVGDWQIFGSTAAFLFDTRSFIQKWLSDVRHLQQPNGMVLNHAPSTPTEGLSGPAAQLHGSAGWGDVIVRAPWDLYQTYGDVGDLEQSWDAMVSWVGYCEAGAREGRSADRRRRHPDPLPHEQYLWDTGFHWGEWFEPGVEVGDFPTFVGADKSEVATAYLCRSASILAEIAAILGKPEGVVDEYRHLAAGARDAWQTEFVSEAGELVVQTQASHVRALAFDLVTERHRHGIADGLARLIRDSRTTVGTGFLSTGMLLSTLAENGHVDLAFELLLQPNEPGWLAMIDRGATTLWERWDGVDVAGVPHDSLNHYSKGAVISFLHEHVAGLVPTSPAYRTFRVRPRPGGGMTSVDQQFQTSTGLIEIRWTLLDDSFELEVVVPDGTVASIVLPSGVTHVAEPGRHRWVEAAVLDLD